MINSRENYDDKNEMCFKPCLLKVDVSSDLLNPGDDLWVTCWWQNIGSMPATEPIYGFMEMEFGHQRTVEAKGIKYSRIRWEPYPGPQQWEPGAICATTCRWNLAQSSDYWGGSYKLFIGLCDSDNVPIDIYGPEMKTAKRVEIGEVDAGWGFGIPTVENTRKPWSVEFNKPADVSDIEPKEKSDTMIIGDRVRVCLACDKPILLGLDDDRVRFDFSGGLPEVVLRCVDDDKIIYSFGPENSVSYAMDRINDNTVSYKGLFIHNCGNIAGFELCYTIREGKLSITLENVWEKAGYELLEVRMPNLISIGGSDVMMVDFYGNGRLIPLEKTLPIGYIHHYDVRNAEAIYNSKAMLVMESKELDNKIFASVQENPDGKKAVLGVAFTAKVRAKGKVASIPVKTTPRVDIDLLDESWGIPSWQAIARFLRQGLKRKNQERYYRALFVRYHVTKGPQPEPGQIRDDSPYAVTWLTEVHSFHEVMDTVKRIHNLIDGGPQVVYIAGWQYQGYDTGYPYVLEVDPRVGTIEDLRQCILEGPKYNALIGMHDNYDDCYPSPYLDERIVARDEEGKLWKGWIWAGGLSWIIGLPKYLKWGYLKQRVKDTVELYGINTTYHLDVLSSEVRRYDFDPACPAAADECLQAKIALIEEFNKYGIDITSETVTHPFVGHIGYAATTRAGHSKETLFPGERNIPLTPMVYHGFIRYDGGGDGKKGILRGILEGSGSGWGENIEMEREYLDAYYLQTLPMGFLYNRVMLDYREEGPLVYIDYGNDSYVKANTEELTYEIVVDGCVLGKDWTTFAPGFKKGSYLVYSLDGGTLCWKAPYGWNDGMALRAVTLTGDGEGEVLDCRVENGKVCIDMPAHTPVRVIPEDFSE